MKGLVRKKQDRLFVRIDNRRSISSLAVSAGLDFDVIYDVDVKIVLLQVSIGKWVAALKKNANFYIY